MSCETCPCRTPPGPDVSTGDNDLALVFVSAVSPSGVPDLVCAAASSPRLPTKTVHFRRRAAQEARMTITRAQITTSRGASPPYRLVTAKTAALRVRAAGGRRGRIMDDDRSKDATPRRRTLSQKRRTAHRKNGVIFERHGETPGAAEGGTGGGEVSPEEGGRRSDHALRTDESVFEAGWNFRRCACCYRSSVAVR